LAVIVLSGKNPNENLAASFNVTHHGDTGGFNLLTREFAAFHSLQTDFTKSNRGRRVLQDREYDPYAASEI
jgi:hypothetical protein